MIELSLIEDETHYGKEQLHVMKEEFRRNFMLHEPPELETRYKPAASPETRIYIKMLVAAIPEMLFKALGEDLSDSINGNFLNALTDPNSGEVPSLIFQFAGDTRSFEFRVKSKDQRTLEGASGKVIGKLLELLMAEESSPQTANYIQTFYYRDEDWTQAK